ncbi:MAG: hypothetical protein EHM35_08790, partial [Planctomycetaceae bacterium]
MTRTRLSSRERVLLALDHREPDRVPFNLTLTVDIYHRLREYLGLPPDPDKPIGVWTNVSPSLDLLDAMEVDFYYAGLNAPSGRKPAAPDDGLLYDEWHIGRTRVDRGDGRFYFEMVKHPLANATLRDI